MKNLLIAIAVILVSSGCVKEHEYAFHGVPFDGTDETKTADVPSDVHDITVDVPVDVAEDVGDVVAEVDNQEPVDVTEILDSVDIPDAPDAFDAVDAQDTTVDICQPECSDLECGDDGCGGSCGTCDNNFDCTEGLCAPDCEFFCDGLDCGTAGPEDVCSCGSCPEGYDCLAEQTCKADCQFLCGESECGTAGVADECTCGQCNEGYGCDAGVCTADCGAICADLDCGGAGDLGECDCGICEKPDTCTDAACVENVCVNSAADCSDGLDCTTDDCTIEQGCVHSLDSGSCVIDDACYEETDKKDDNPCLHCVPGINKEDWTPLPLNSPCMPPHTVQGKCEGPMCMIQECQFNWANCDGNGNNGCETDTMISNEHCGGCNKPCNVQGGESCVQGTCSN